MGNVRRRTEWDFRKDGRLLTKGYNYAADRVMTMEDSYKIVDGKIETGQGGKYAVVEKREKEMILKGPFGFTFSPANRPVGMALGKLDKTTPALFRDPACAQDIF